MMEAEKVATTHNILMRFKAALDKDEETKGVELLSELFKLYNIGVEI